MEHDPASDPPDRLQPTSFVPDETIDRIERAALAAMPARTRWELPGWVCLADDGGFVGRANAATPLQHARHADLAAVVESYASRHLRPVVRWTRLAPPDAATQLGSEAWSTWGEVLVMTRDLESPGLPVAEGRAVRHGSSTAVDAATDDWTTVYASRYAAEEAVVRSRLALDAPAPKRYVTVMVEGVAAGVGLTVLQDGALGVFDVLTLPGWRRAGVASLLMSELLAWGRSCGADVSYLQVAADNSPAVALYRRLGYTTAYTYVYAAPT